MKIKLSDIRLAQLNNDCISLASKFSRVLRAHNGTSLRLNDRNVLVTLFQEASTTENKELKRLAQHLKKQIALSLQKQDYQSNFQEYQSENQMGLSGTAA